jgi:hypothetical protein
VDLVNGAGVLVRGREGALMASRLVLIDIDSATTPERNASTVEAFGDDRGPQERPPISQATSTPSPDVAANVPVAAMAVTHRRH